MLHLNKLEKARINIDLIDQEMAKLFEKRMQEVNEVITYKMEQGLPIFDQKREQQVIEKNLKYINNNELKPYYEAFLNALMGISKEYQSKKL